MPSSPVCKMSAVSSPISEPLSADEMPESLTDPARHPVQVKDDLGAHFGPVPAGAGRAANPFRGRPSHEFGHPRVSLGPEITVKGETRAHPGDPLWQGWHSYSASSRRSAVIGIRYLALCGRAKYGLLSVALCGQETTLMLERLVQPRRRCAISFRRLGAFDQRSTVVSSHL